MDVHGTKNLRNVLTLEVTNECKYRQIQAARNGQRQPATARDKSKQPQTSTYSEDRVHTQPTTDSSRQPKTTVVWPRAATDSFIQPQAAREAVDFVVDIIIVVVGSYPSHDSLGTVVPGRTKPNTNHAYRTQTRLRSTRTSRSLKQKANHGKFHP